MGDGKKEGQKEGQVGLMSGWVAAKGIEFNVLYFVASVGFAPNSILRADDGICLLFIFNLPAENSCVRN